MSAKRRLPSIVFAALCLLTGCKATEEQAAQSGDMKAPAPAQGGGQIIENRSQITATVLEIKSQQTGFSLRLRVEAADTVAGYVPAVTAGRDIEVFPNFKRNEGRQIDYSTDENKHLLEAGKLEAGDRITATIYNRGRSYLLMAWQRE